MRNPIISSVVYLSSSTTSSAAATAAAAAAAGAAGGGSLDGSETLVGGPTLVTDQRLGGELATKGWLAYPAVNRVTMFDGRVLHGEHAGNNS